MPASRETSWDVEFGRHTDVGKVRQRNEDASKAGMDPPLFAVADGMGGHRAGDRASRIAVDSLFEFFTAADGASRQNHADAFRGAFRLANERIMEDAADRPDRSGMGTTLTALTLDGDEYWIGHVGDSRALLIRNGALEQLTEDHSVVAAQVREGWMTAEEAEVHPLRHVLSRCMGCEPAPEVDVITGLVQPGDVFVLASDGLTSALPAVAIAEAVTSASDADEASRLLVERAKTRDGSDNITAVVVACKPR